MPEKDTLDALDPEGREIQVLTSLVKLAGRDVLEIGSGNGRLTWRYAAHAASVIGLEPNEALVARARAATPAALENRVDFRAADAARVELTLGRFDVAVFSWSM